jgi:putative DNA primase/helicase
MTRKRRLDGRDWSDLVEQARCVDMVGLVERHGVKLREVGPEYVGPCPVCGTGDDRFSIRPVAELFNCRVCARGGKGAIDLQMFLTGDDDFVTSVKQLTGTDIPSELRTNTAEAKARDKLRQQEDVAYEVAQHRKATWLWSQRRPPQGTIVETYLHARGYHFPIPPTIGFLPASGDYAPAMIAAFALPQEYEPGALGKPCDVRSVHLTPLLPDGSDRLRTKDAKKIIGRPLGRPIAVSAIGDGSSLAISEGIEDALAYAAAGYGSWAAGSAPHLPPLALTIPDYVTTLIIEQHADENGVGERETKKLVQALRERECERRKQKRKLGVRPERAMEIIVCGGRE